MASLRWLILLHSHNNCPIILSLTWYRLYSKDHTFIPTHYNLLHSNVLLSSSKVSQTLKFFQDSKNIYSITHHIQIKILKHFYEIFVLLSNTKIDIDIFYLPNDIVSNRSEKSTWQSLLKHCCYFGISDRKIAKWLKRSKSKYSSDCDTWCVLIVCVIYDILARDCNSYCFVSSC